MCIAHNEWHMDGGKYTPRASEDRYCHARKSAHTADMRSTL